MADFNTVVDEEGEDGEKLKEELSACQHFLVDTEMENGRHKVSNFQTSKFDTKMIIEKLEKRHSRRRVCWRISQAKFWKV